MLARLLILLALSLSSTYGASAQAISPIDRQKLRQAERTADQFVERFRQTLDFGTVWKEFQVSDGSCNYKLNGPWTDEGFERLKLNGTLVERVYIALMNCYYLSLAYRLSILPFTENEDDGEAAERRLPKEIHAAEGKVLSLVMGDAAKPGPHTAKEFEEMAVELQQLAMIWRKHAPHNMMRTASWRANIRSLLSREGIGHLRVDRGGQWDLCIPDGVTYYLVDRGLFYFYFIEEKGRMRVVRFGLGD
jgi:hypothetical protein